MENVSSFIGTSHVKSEHIAKLSHKQASKSMEPAPCLVWFFSRSENKVCFKKSIKFRMKRCLIWLKPPHFLNKVSGKNMVKFQLIRTIYK